MSSQRYEKKGDVGRNVLGYFRGLQRARCTSSINGRKVIALEGEGGSRTQY